MRRAWLSMNDEDEPIDSIAAQPAPPGRSDAKLRLLDQVAVFQYVTVPHAPTYRAIMQIFHEAKQHYVIELRPAEVLEQLRRSDYHVELPDDDALHRALDQLVDWGNLLRTHDTAAVSHIEDFYRRRHLYHLTAVGEAAHRAVLEVEATLGKAGALQTTMLVKIRDTLRSLAAQLVAPPPDPATLVTLLHDLHAAFDTLTQEANRFIGELGRHGGERVDEERFAMYKRAVLAYIGRFVGELRRLAAEIAVHVQASDAAGMDGAIATAATAAELPPVLDGRDPVADWIAEQRARWEGIRTWFVGSRSHPEPTVERLASVAVNAVVGLTRALARLNDRRTRPVDRAADYRTLARWFAGCANDEDAHRLWQAATGIYAARHFHIAEEDVDLAGRNASWWDAAPVAVPIRLRTHGATSSAGRPSPAQDYSADKQWIAQVRRREREQLAAAMRRFAGHGRLDLRAIERLDSAEFDLLLSLLDQALGAPRGEDGTRRARTADGRLLVVLQPPAPDDVDVVTLGTPRGRLRCRNYRIEVMDAFPAAAAGTRARQGSRA
jgi:uncharacterized protein (TIGR02677 family)